ncbi:BZ3500_MvSof-1268-A1-R1_Chr5-2g07776 [Microbotryum saponariae]|uniref:BZ3500_MvSof-1268-A1-R1_Chr5-2g07776 protein n=1 Tax=Microbotryum saponariae TaxID=289078 RepID=A0A2X0M8Y8_9BASI|nr:BZ3500_MvSof-1268-A1-R1_Chr5-2g07776 [Microbotryum saponariae]SDA05645.1 BZ3501_MvSof-1269-A2-R1_Chr5-2g07598 [Microbotryum saponariae]
MLPNSLSLLGKLTHGATLYTDLVWPRLPTASPSSPAIALRFSSKGMPYPPKFRGLHQRLNATGRSVKKAKHHQLPAHNRSGTRGPMETSGSTTRRGLHRWPQDGEMGSSSDESYGDDFAGQEDEYFSGV